MGFMTEQTILGQLRKAQESTDARLDRLVAEQQRTNQLLEWVGKLLAEKVDA